MELSPPSQPVPAHLHTASQRRLNTRSTTDTQRARLYWCRRLERSAQARASRAASKGTRQSRGRPGHRHRRYGPQPFLISLSKKEINNPFSGVARYHLLYSCRQDRCGAVQCGAVRAQMTRRSCNSLSKKWITLECYIFLLGALVAAFLLRTFCWGKSPERHGPPSPMLFSPPHTWS